MIVSPSSVALPAGLLAASLLAGAAYAAPASAAAYPVKAPALTKSTLYTSGALPTADCPEQPVTAGSVASARKYVMPLLNCLNQSWSQQLKKAGIAFSKPRIQFITRPQRVCGEKWPKKTQGLYCPSYRKMVILLDKDIVEQAESLFLMDVISHEYGHHIQNLAGIESAFNRLQYRDKKEYYEQYRRLELQAECFAGAFIGSVWDSLDRTTDDWDYLIDATRESGDEYTKIRDHGKGRNIANWLSRGYKAASPSACNTWSAGAAMVAATPAT
ncbi:neutral zinc metallopeptidase [Sphaerisporangium fuscum]|uniref:neutral zinc metallopeptidase n=1 Tax=Sphaerisporangium fuscum TaxID=2835868 RepID=UPI001BDC156A|nr:neutral zinc metallopeptidase [Sphaerisporangium fuscum]